MRIVLLRHGETDMPGRLLGRTDAELSDAGWRQFERQTESLAFGAVVTSPRRRARLPAEAFAAVRDVPLKLDNDWAEIDFGDWDGRLLDELRADAAIEAGLREMYKSAECDGAPGGESWGALCARVERAIDRLFAFGEESNVLVSTHAGPMRAALAVACGLPFASLWAIRVDYGTRITLQVGRDENAGLWGEVIEVLQP